MRRTLVTLLLFAACALAAPAPAAVAPRAYEVYAAYLRGAVGEKRAREAEIVVCEDTGPYRRPTGEKAPELEATCEGMPADLVDAFRDETDGQDRLVENQFDGLAVSLMPAAEHDGYFEAGVGKGWEGFYARHPESDGFYSFSRVAFDRTGTWAAMYASRSCGGLCGGGSYVVMHERDGKWTVACEDELWVS